MDNIGNCLKDSADSYSSKQKNGCVLDDFDVDVDK